MCIGRNTKGKWCTGSCNVTICKFIHRHTYLAMKNTRGSEAFYLHKWHDMYTSTVNETVNSGFRDFSIILKYFKSEVF